jgi:hypothetical protein
MYGLLSLDFLTASNFSFFVKKNTLFLCILNKIDTSNYEESITNNIICVIMCLFDLPYYWSGSGFEPQHFFIFKCVSLTTELLDKKNVYSKKLSMKKNNINYF